MPFGLTNAPAICQELVNDTLKRLLNKKVIVYLDDILIYTTGTLEEHIRDVREVFDKLQERNLRIAPEKCEFYKKEVKFLGFIVGVNGIKIDPDKTKSV